MVFCLDGYQTPTDRPSPPKMKTLKVSSQLVYSVFKENELCNHLSSLASMQFQFWAFQLTRCSLRKVQPKTSPLHVFLQRYCWTSWDTSTLCVLHKIPSSAVPRVDISTTWSSWLIFGNQWTAVRIWCNERYLVLLILASFEEVLIIVGSTAAQLYVYANILYL